MLLAELGEDARPLAGGHSLVPMMKLRLAEPSHLVDLGAIAALKGIRAEGGEIVIGAMTTQQEIIASELLAERLPILCEAARQIADPQVRYVGTLGGNCAGGDPGNDMPAVMQCLGATYVLDGPNGTRKIAARDFYEGAFTTGLQPGEILSAVRVPVPAQGHGYAYAKMKRKVGDYATAATAVILTLAGGRCTSASIALTNLAATPLHAADAAKRAGRDRPRWCGDRSRGRGRGRDHRSRPRPARSRRFPQACRGRHDQAGDRERAWPRHGNRQRARARWGRQLMAKHQIKLTVNGRTVEALVETRLLLIHFLREALSLTGAHIGCETSHCGACTVDMGGRSVKSCTLFAVQADGTEITTVEGLATAAGLHPLQEGFVQAHGLQCGFCTPGMIMRSYRLLHENADPTDEEIRMGLSGNLCRCTGYQNIVKAVRYAAVKLASQAKEAARS